MTFNKDTAIKILGIVFTPSRIISWKIIVNILTGMIISLSFSRNSKENLVLLLELERLLYQLTSKAAIEYDSGMHPKHRLTKYHDFFTNRISNHERVIDIGSGNGILAFAMAKEGAVVTGIDLNKKYHKHAIENYKLDNLTYIHGDVLNALPELVFDTAVMSNVLEHIEDRVEFLKHAQNHLKVKRWLFRVPLYERDWRVPLMDEVGIDYRLDKTHFIEYTQEIFEKELNDAMLQITYKEIRWGEIWCEACPI